jgi:hypothetical protein
MAGGDGSGGVRIIKRTGGVVIAQDADTAQLPGTPRSAIATGAVDLIVPLNDIASCLGMLVATGKAQPGRCIRPGRLRFPKNDGSKAKITASSASTKGDQLLI